MKETAESRWTNLWNYRSIALRRAIDCSKLTIPNLIPESDQTDPLVNTYNSIPSLYQGVGARGVNGLAAKLLLSLYPPQVPFFRLSLDSARVRDYVQRNGIQRGRRCLASWTLCCPRWSRTSCADWISCRQGKQSSRH